MNSNCDSVKNETDFIWCLLFLYFVKELTSEAKELVSSMYDQEFDIGSECEDLLLQFWEQGESSSLIDLAKNKLRLQSFDIEKHVLLIAALVDKKLLSINNASLLLDVNVGDEHNVLRPPIQNVLDVAWLTNEDSKGGFMEPVDDDLLFDVLKNALIEKRMS